MFVPDGLGYVQTNSYESGNLVKYSTFLLLASSNFLKKSQWENIALILPTINRVYVLIVLFWMPILMPILLFVLRHRECCPSSLSLRPLPIFEKIFTCFMSLSSFLSSLISFRVRLADRTSGQWNWFRFKNIYYLLFFCQIHYNCFEKISVRWTFKFISLSKLNARFICTVCTHRIRWSCEGLMSIPQQIHWIRLKHLLLTLYNSSLPNLMCHSTCRLCPCNCSAYCRNHWVNDRHTVLYGALSSCSCRC